MPDAMSTPGCQPVHPMIPCHHSRSSPQLTGPRPHSLPCPPLPSWLQNFRIRLKPEEVLQHLASSLQLQRGSPGAPSQAPTLYGGAGASSLPASVMLPKMATTEEDGPQDDNAMVSEETLLPILTPSTEGVTGESEPGPVSAEEDAAAAALTSSGPPPPLTVFIEVKDFVARSLSAGFGGAGASGDSSLLPDSNSTSLASSSTVGLPDASPTALSSSRPTPTSGRTTTSSTQRWPWGQGAATSCCSSSSSSGTVRSNESCHGVGTDPASLSIGMDASLEPFALWRLPRLSSLVESSLLPLTPGGGGVNGYSASGSPSASCPRAKKPLVWSSSTLPQAVPEGTREASSSSSSSSSASTGSWFSKPPAERPAPGQGHRHRNTAKGGASMELVEILMPSEEQDPEEVSGSVEREEGVRGSGTFGGDCKACQGTIALLRGREGGY